MLTDERAKQLMQRVGMPNSLSLLQALRQCDMEATLAEREACAKTTESEAVDADATGADSDFAYNQAIADAATAIRAR